MEGGEWLQRAILTIALAFALTWILLRFRNTQRRDSLLLVGLPGSGKTALFGRLCGYPVHKTVSSIQPNEGCLRGRTKEIVRVVDIPGHRKVRQMYAEYLDRARIILVPFRNTTTEIMVPQRISELAQLLYDILSAESVCSGKVRVILFASAGTSSSSVPVDKCQIEIEAWLTQVREARDKASRLEESTAFHYLGYDGQPLKLSHLETSVVVTDEEDTLRELIE